MTTPVDQAVDAAMRKKFEEWVAITHPYALLTKSPDGRYDGALASWAWEAWQASATLARQLEVAAPPGGAGAFYPQVTGYATHPLVGGAGGSVGADGVSDKRLLEIWKACRAIDNREFCVEFGRAVIAEATPNARGQGEAPIAPAFCPITGRKFWGNIAHPRLGVVATYGGPLDTYTIPHLDDDGEVRCEQFDQDAGNWTEGGEPLGWFYEDQQGSATPAPDQATPLQPQDANDARRYLWLLPRLSGRAYREAGIIYSDGIDSISDAIDAAILASTQGEKS